MANGNGTSGTYDEEMKRLLAMREEQDRQLEEIRARLTAMANVQIAIPNELLEELESCIRPRATVGAPTIQYLRG